MKKKIIAFLTILCCFMMILFDIVYADTSYVVQLPTFPKYDTTTFPYYIVRQWDSGEYDLIILQKKDTASDGTHIYFTGRWKSCHYTPSTSPEDNVWSSFGDIYDGSSWASIICPINLDMSLNTIVYSNFDITYNGTLLRSKLEMNDNTFEQPSDNVTMSGISGFFDSLFSKLGNWFSSVINGLGNIINKIVEVGSTIVNGIGSFFSTLFEKLGYWFDTVFSVIREVTSNIVNKIIDLGSTIVNGIGEFFSNLIDNVIALPDLIVSGLKALFELLFIPSDNLFTPFKEIIEEKFAIFFQLGKIVFDSTTIELNDAAPNFHITIDGKDYCFVDLSFYAQYRAFIHGIIILITCFSTYVWLVRNFPNIVLGQGVDKDTGEVYTTISNGRK